MTSQQDAPGLKARLKFAAKLGVTLMILVVILVRVDWRIVADKCAGASFWPLAAALALFLATNAMVGVRWKLIADRLALPLTLPSAVELTFASLYLGQVLPAAVGSDAVRFWVVWRTGTPARLVLASVAADRLAALIGIMAVVVGVSLPILAPIAPPAFSIASGAAVAALALGIAAFTWFDRLPFLSRWLGRWTIGRQLLEVVGDVRMALSSSSALPALGLSIVVQLVGIAAVWLIAAGLHVPLGLLQCLAVVPPAVLATAVPISINGWGVREGAMIAGLGLYGVSLDDAFVVSLLVGLGAVLASLPGMVFWRTLGVAARPK